MARADGSRSWANASSALKTCRGICHEDSAGRPRFVSQAAERLPAGVEIGRQPPVTVQTGLDHAAHLPVAAQHRQDRIGVEGDSAVGRIAAQVVDPLPAPARDERRRDRVRPLEQEARLSRRHAGLADHLDDEISIQHPVRQPIADQRRLDRLTRVLVPQVVVAKRVPIVEPGDAGETLLRGGLDHRIVQRARAPAGRETKRDEPRQPPGWTWEEDGLLPASPGRHRQPPFAPFILGQHTPGPATGRAVLLERRGPDPSYVQKQR
ncbi:MAG: hypothetical protein DMF50_11795 [Acidobacteria bacterium]|nr:MAG: hypothetical protein DMF50_11795 [Acidobacteriota bacterium]